MGKNSESFWARISKPGIVEKLDRFGPTCSRMARKGQMSRMTQTGQMFQYGPERSKMAKAQLGPKWLKIAQMQCFHKDPQLRTC